MKKLFGFSFSLTIGLALLSGCGGSGRLPSSITPTTGTTTPLAQATSAPTAVAPQQPLYQANQGTTGAPAPGARAVATPNGYVYSNNQQANPMNAVYNCAGKTNAQPNSFASNPYQNPCSGTNALNPNQRQAANPYVGTPNNQTQTYGANTSSYGQTPQAYGANTSAYGQTQQAYSANTSSYGATTPAYGQTQQAYGANTSSYGAATPAYGQTPQAYGASTPAYGGVAAQSAYRAPVQRAPQTNYAAPQYGAQTTQKRRY